MAHKGPELYLEPRISKVAAHLYIWSTMVTSMLVHTYVGVQLPDGLNLGEGFEGWQ